MCEQRSSQRPRLGRTVSPRRPAASDAATRKRMRNQKRRETRPELALRRELWSRGLRYRVDAALPLRGGRRRADLLFTRARVAVFVDGCYWHSCPLHGTAPRANASWWAAKLQTNVWRDRDTDLQLAELGWLSVRVWEHEEAFAAADRVAALVQARRPQRGYRSGPPVASDQ